MANGNDPRALPGLQAPQRPQARGPLEFIARTLGQRRDQSLFEQQREQIIEMGAARLERIGTPLAKRSAGAFRQNPAAFMQHLDQFGGMQAFEQGLLDRASEQGEIGRDAALAQVRLDFENLPKDQQTAENLFLAARRAGATGKEAEDMASRFQKVQPAPAGPRRIIQEDGVNFFVGSGKRVLPEDDKLMDEPLIPTVPVDKQFESEGQIRREYTALSQPFIKRRQAVGQINALADLAKNERNPIAQRGLIFGMFKLWDEASTVREGEQAQIEQARAPFNLFAAYNQLVRGEILTGTQIDQLVKTSQVSMLSAVEMQKDIEQQFFKIADFHDLPRISAVPDWIAEWRDFKVPATQDVVDAYEEKLGTSDPTTILDAMRRDGVTIE